MPLLVDTPNAPPVEKPTPVQIAKPAYKGVVVDTQYIPQSSLITGIEGSSWTVDYFSQVVNDDNDLSGQQIARDPIYQQYRLIRGMELKVQNPLTPSQDTDSKQLTITGTAVTYPFLIPQEGDMFIADVGDGREGVFRITNTEVRSYFEQACYQIDYVQVDYSTALRRGDLIRKVVEELYFVRDFLLHGQNPLLYKQDYIDVQTLSQRYAEILDVYMRMFMSHEFKTLILPGQDYPIYDHFVAKAITALFEVSRHPDLMQMRVLNVDDSDVLKCFTLWDMLIRRDADLLPFVNKRVGLVNARSFTERPQLEGIRYTGINYVVYPTDPDVCVDYEVRKPQVPASSTEHVKPVPARKGALEYLMGKKVLSGLPYNKAPLIKDVTVDDYYIFSQAFYEEQDGGLSQLEALVRDYLNDKAIDRSTLVLLTETYQAYGGLERFYYLPIILLLIKASIRSL